MMQLEKSYEWGRFGVALVTPDDSAFGGLAAEILGRPHPMGPPPESLQRAAVLVNRSGQAIVALAYIWRYTAADGRTTVHSHTNFGSSIQLDVLAGRAAVVRDRFSFILPGAKRLITEDGLFGDNADVLLPEEVRLGGGFGVSRAGSGRRGGAGEETAAAELQLDAVFFEDGVCAGPGELGLFESVTEDLERQRSVAGDIVEVLRSGGTAGQVFEILSPLARRPAAGAEARHQGKHTARLLPMFASMGIHQLIQAGDAEVREWFERAAQAPAARMRRAPPDPEP